MLFFQKRKLIIDHIKNHQYFNQTAIYCTNDHGITIDSANKKAIYAMRTENSVKSICFDLKDILKIELKRNEEIIVKSERSPDAGGAIIGGILGGLPGAIWGGLVKSKKVKYEEKYLKSIKIIFSLESEPETSYEILFNFDTYIKPDSSQYKAAFDMMKTLSAEYKHIQENLKPSSEKNDYQFKLETISEKKDYCFTLDMTSKADSDLHTLNTLCKKCQNNVFKYDNYYKEYTCVECGYTLKI